MYVGGHAFLTQFSNPEQWMERARPGGRMKLNKVPNSAEVRVCNSDTDGHRFEPHMDTFFSLPFFLPTYKAG